MPCEHYKDALIESAATGAEPQGELRAHLAACAACLAAFAEEQSLFSSIDAGLRASANAEVPASLLPRVRARLDEAVPTRNWETNWFVLAGAAAMVIVFFAAQARWHPSTVQKPVETAAKTNSSAPAMPPLQDRNSIPVSPTKENPVSQPRVATAKNFVPQESLAVRNPRPEILVPRDQEVLLVRYAEEWQSRKRAPLMAENSGGTTLTPLQIAPIQIAQLDVKLLAEEHAQ